MRASPGLQRRMMATLAARPTRGNAAATPSGRRSAAANNRSRTRASKPATASPVTTPTRADRPTTSWTRWATARRSTRLMARMWPGGYPRDCCRIHATRPEDGGPRRGGGGKGQRSWHGIATHDPTMKSVAATVSLPRTLRSPWVSGGARVELGDPTPPCGSRARGLAATDDLSRRCCPGPGRRCPARCRGRPGRRSAS